MHALTKNFQYYQLHPECVMHSAGAINVMLDVHCDDSPNCLLRGA
jgi:hypothetical protein